MDKIQRIKDLTKQLQYAARAYYTEGNEIMSNFEYDALYDELEKLEKEMRFFVSGTPTHRVGYEIASSLPKKTHEIEMLSLDKTKEIADLEEWIGTQRAVLSWKMDGLTIVLTYREGRLVEALTRGNGSEGEVITNNAKNFTNIPLQIPFLGELIVRGEAIIRYSDFLRINASIEDVDAKYKNPRNLCSGSVRQLDPQVTKQRHVGFYVFNVVKADGIDFHNTKENQFIWITSQGFETVEYVITDKESLREHIADFAKKVEKNDIPSDGLVLLLNDIAYGESLGTTAKFPRNAMAFKWKDEVGITYLREIEWSPSRTGLINPIAIFDPVELEGTSVSRASVHNISILKALELGVGDEITVYKANMIIPQIAKNHTKSNSIDIPTSCPACHMDTVIKADGAVETLFCPNLFCPAKHIKLFTLMASRDALNIDGLSESTLEKFVAKGFITEPADIFKIERYKADIILMEGFGEKSYENLLRALREASHTSMARFVYALGIAGIGVANAKMISRFFKEDMQEFRQATTEELVKIDGIGEVLANAIVAYFSDEKNQRIVDNLLEVVKIEIHEKEENQEENFAGFTFVITGSLFTFANRDALKEEIEKRGGKVVSSVSAKTNYLINNDTTSSSSKNKKAKELGIPILSEEDFLQMLL